MAKQIVCPHCQGVIDLTLEGAGADAQIVAAAVETAPDKPESEDDIFATMLGGDDGDGK